MDWSTEDEIMLARDQLQLHITSIRKAASLYIYMYTQHHTTTPQHTTTQQLTVLTLLEPTPRDRLYEDMWRGSHKVASGFIYELALNSKDTAHHYIQYSKPCTTMST